MKTAFLIVAAALLAGCATPNTGIQPIGNGVYMASKFGGMMTFSGGEVKAELYQEAGAYCGKQGKQVQPLDSTSRDSSYGRHASAEIQFRCH